MGPGGGILEDVYRVLVVAYGPQEWWPAETDFEVVVGAILTQNTAWTNVERAIIALDQAGGLTPAGLRGLERGALEELIRPSGFYRQKAERLQAFVEYLYLRHQGSLAQFLGGDVDGVRKELLALRGIGPETADAILLYAGGRPTFVVDAYTRRLFQRLGWLRGDESYVAIRDLFMTHLPADPTLYNEYHALVVAHGKRHCRKTKPLCSGCPLLLHCHFPPRSATSPD